jgi:hypothetical protein
MQAGIDARIEATAAAGPLCRRVSTPFGMATVEERIGKLSGNKVDGVCDSTARARAASEAGKYKSCEKALTDRNIMAH